MKFLFCPLYEISQDEVIKNSKVLPNFSITNFNEKIINGLRLNLGDDLSIISTRTIAAFPKYKKIINSNKQYDYKGIDCKEIFFVNLPIVKYFFEFLSLYFNIKSWIKKNKKDDNLYICSYGRRISHALAINLIKKKHSNIVTCMIYGDLSGKYATNINLKKSISKDYLSNIFLNYSIKQSLKFDKAVFLTKYMSEVLSTNKPYIVMEGMCDEAENEQFHKGKNNKCKIMYTGIISKKYSLDLLINAMEFLPKNKYELVLYGIGDFVCSLNNLEYENIKYMGYKNQVEVRKAQNNADILINPRQRNGEYTRYSFPSKTLEYLKTGNPVICFKLDGIPDEYDNYLFYVKEDNAMSIAKKILEVSQMSSFERSEYKSSVLYFLLNNKTQSAQCRRIIEFMQKKSEKENE